MNDFNKGDKVDFTYFGRNLSGIIFLVKKDIYKIKVPFGIIEYPKKGALGFENLRKAVNYEKF